MKKRTRNWIVALSITGTFLVGCTTNNQDTLDKLTQENNQLTTENAELSIKNAELFQQQSSGDLEHTKLMPFVTIASSFDENAKVTAISDSIVQITLPEYADMDTMNQDILGQAETIVTFLEETTEPPFMFDSCIITILDDNNSVLYGYSINTDGATAFANIALPENPDNKVVNETVSVDQETEANVEPAIYEGVGDSVIQIENPYDIAVLHIVGNDECRYFAVKGYDADDNQTELFVNTTEAYSGIVFDVEQSTTSLEISATGAWSVEVKSVFSCDTISAGDTVSGVGDAVVLIKGDSSTADIIGNPDERYFSVKSYGESIDLLVSTADKYEGTVKLKNDPVLLTIAAQGDWTVNLH